MLKKLFTHSLIYSLAPQAPKLASLLLMPIITKHATTLDYGIYGIISSYLFFAAALKDLGLGVVFVNTFYKHLKKWPIIWRLLHGHLILWGFVFAIILLVLLKIAIPAEASKNFWTIAALIIIPAVLFDTTSLIGNYYFRFSQKPLFIGIVTIVTGVLTVFATYYFIVVLNQGYMGWFVASFLSSFCMFAFYFYPVYVKLKLIPIVTFRKKFIMPHFKVALPMIPHNYSSYLLNSSDRVIMDQFKVNINQIGQYNIAYTFGNYFESVGEAIGMAVGPFYSKLYTSKNKQALIDERNFTFFLMIGFLVATFLISLWLKEIFLLLISNKELRSAYDIGGIIIMSYAYRPMYWSAGIKLSIFEKTSVLWRISFVAGITNVLLNIVFVKQFGIYAAAISTMISLLYMGFSGYFFKSYKKLGGPNHYPLIWLSAIIFLTIIFYLLKNILIAFKIVITLGVLVSWIFWGAKNLKKLKTMDV